MRLEPFEACQVGGVARNGRRGTHVVQVQPGAEPQEREHGEACSPARRSAGGEHVVGTDAVIAEDLGGARSEEEGAAVAQASRHRLGVAGQDLDVLWRQPVADLDGGVEVRCQDRETAE